MKHLISFMAMALILMVFSFDFSGRALGQTPATDQAKSQGVASLPVRSICLGSPAPDQVDAYVKFIHDELAPRQVNVLIMRVDYNYQYESHPELRRDNALSKADIKKIVAACKAAKIQLIPQLNLLGHQSSKTNPGVLLTVYPQFDETPWVQIPKTYKWPNSDGYYSKSYCPLNPDVHKVVFALVDELCDVCEADAFHAGLDEVFYIGEDKCPRCGGKDHAELFAGEVKRIHDHLAEKGRKMWMWGDRLLNSKTTHLSIWRSSANGTWPAVDMIPKDIVICDWQYTQDTKTAKFFADKGFGVVSCSLKTRKITLKQVEKMLDGRKNASPKTRDNYLGVMQTVWGSDWPDFIKDLANSESDKAPAKDTVADNFKTLFPKQ
jgi:hypothetical protein